MEVRRSAGVCPVGDVAPPVEDGEPDGASSGRSSYAHSSTSATGNPSSSRIATPRAATSGSPDIWKRYSAPWATTKPTTTYTAPT